MERPEVNITKFERTITGEVVYLNEWRQSGKYPKTPYVSLNDEDKLRYEEQAEVIRSSSETLPIMGEYKLYDTVASPDNASLSALADYFLKLKNPNYPYLTFVDICLEESPEKLLEAVKASSFANLLHSDDEDLAISSDGSYYPELHFSKKDAEFLGAGLRVFGWEDSKIGYTGKASPKGRKDFIVYPSSELSKSYELGLTFTYRVDNNYFQESVKMSLNPEARLYSSVWASAYAETGYEGHKFTEQESTSSQQINDFADLIAGAVGDRPEAVWQYQERIAE